MNSYLFDDLKQGMTFSFEKQIKEEDLLIFSNLTGDKNPLHLNEEYARTTFFKKRVVFGSLIQSYLSTLAGMYVPGKYSLILNIESQFRNPVFIGDKLKVEGEIIKKISFSKIIEIKTNISNQNNLLVLTGKMLVQVLK